MKVNFLACSRLSVSQKKKKTAAIEGVRRVGSGKGNRDDAGRTAPLPFPDPARPPLFFLPDPACRSSSGALLTESLTQATLFPFVLSYLYCWCWPWLWSLRQQSQTEPFL